MTDYGHEQTDKELVKLERRISKVYAEAEKDLAKKAKDYFEAFADRDAEQQALLKAGKITEAQYKQWRLAQIGRGKRFEAMRDQMAERVTKANETAISYVNDATPGIYSLNHNYAAYTIEQVAGDVGFTLLDEQTAKRMIVDAPDSMPYYPPKRAIKRGIDLAYGKKQITAQVTQSILTGESVKGIADRLQKSITDMNRTSAVRAARTAATGAENAGRMDSYTAAEKMGIRLKKQWMATIDGRTRHSHAMLDGKSAEKDKKFDNGCMFPGDPSGPPAEVYNCRCTLIADLLDYPDMEPVQRRIRDPETGRNVVVDDMTYEEWAKGKRNTERMVAKSKVMEHNKTINGKVSVNAQKVYDDAKNGVRHRGIYSKAMCYRQSTLEKSIASHVAQVQEHAAKISNPAKYDAGWKNKTQVQKEGLIQKWKKDMQRNAEQGEIEISVWKERFDK